MTAADRAGVAFAALAVTVSASLWSFGTPYDATHPAIVSHTANVPADRDAFVAEDSPRWSCLIHGNGLCGPFHGPTR